MFKQRIWLRCLRQLASRNTGRLGHTKFETQPQYDVSEKMRKLFEEKKKLREASKAYFQKMVMNPYRPKTDTAPFDPVFFRYNAFMTYHDEYYKPSLKNNTFYVIFYIMPMLLVGLYFTYSEKSYEKQIRAGEIPYEERHRGVL